MADVDFFDVPSFDGKGLYKAATDDAWKQTAAATKKSKKNKAKKPSDEIGAPSTGKVKRDGGRDAKFPSKGRRDDGAPGASGKKRKDSEGGETPSGGKKEVDDSRPSGKNLGKRRRAKEKKLRLKGLAEDSGAAPADQADADGDRPAKKRKKAGKQAAVASPAPAEAVVSPPKKTLKEKRKEKKALKAQAAAAAAAVAPAAAARPAASLPAASSPPAAAQEAKKKQAKGPKAPAAAAAAAAAAAPAAAAGNDKASKKRKAEAAADEPTPQQPQQQKGGNAAAASQKREARAQEASRGAVKASAPPAAAAAPPAAAAAKKGKDKKGSSLLEKAQKQLSGGQFRWLNEELYTRSGDAALSLFGEQPELFDAYHEGFQSQTKSWPKQPLDIAIKWLKGKTRRLRVADFGCGEARLAATLGAQHEVHSFDLVARAPGVVACNMASIPLDDAAVDVAVFCLSLMGTDYHLGLAEAHRVLVSGGTLWVAEVRSRFEGVPNAVEQFISALGALGFKLQSRDDGDKMFVIFVFVKLKGDGPADGAGKKGGKGGKKAAAWPQLKACEYKRR